MIIEFIGNNHRVEVSNQTLGKIINKTNILNKSNIMKRLLIIACVLIMGVAKIVAQPTGSESELYYNLGYSYYHGVDGGEPDYYNAIQWLIKAAELNNLKAYELLGDCFYGGYGVEKDINMAISYYYTAASQGSSTAQCSLGILYGEIGDKEEKKRWLTKSAENGNANAQYFLAMYYLLDTNRTNYDIDKMMYWFSSSVVNGSALGRLEMKKVFNTWMAANNLK